MLILTEISDGYNAYMVELLINSDFLFKSLVVAFDGELGLIDDLARVIRRVQGAPAETDGRKRTLSDRAAHVVWANIARNGDSCRGARHKGRVQKTILPFSISLSRFRL
jgi:hypothetical protein